MADNAVLDLVVELKKENIKKMIIDLETGKATVIRDDEMEVTIPLSKLDSLGVK